MSGNPHDSESAASAIVSWVLRQYYVYILTNRWHTVLYTGMTGNIEGRVFNHKTKASKGFTNKYNCDRLVHLETFASVRDAIAREKELKKYRRAWKNNLIRENNPNWEDLSEEWYDPKELAAAFLRVPGSSPPKADSAPE